MRRLIVLAALTGSIPVSTRAAPFLSDAVETQILAQNIQQNINLSRQIQQFQASLALASDHLALTRSIYGLANDATHFNAQDELQFVTRYFIGTQIDQANAFAADVARNGIKGTFSGYAVNKQIDALTVSKACDDYKKHAIAACQASQLLPAPPIDCAWLTCTKTNPEGSPSSTPPPGYNAKAAQTLASTYDDVLADPKKRDQVLTRAPVYSESEGIWVQKMLLTDPSVGDALLRERASARRNYASAAGLYASSLDANATVGAATKMTAQTSALSAQELAAIHEIEAKRLAMDQIAHTEQAVKEAEGQRADTTRTYYLGSMLYRSFTGKTDPNPGQPTDVPNPRPGQ